MHLYNTLTRKIEKFIPNNKSEVKMYTCGPTVYHYAHIGNLRSYIMEDVLEKTLNYIGYNVNRVMNITDVGHLSSDADTGEDKMVKGAIREKKTVIEIADFYTDAFKKDCEKLNIKWPNTVVKATSCIDEYIKIVKTLIEKDYAYISNGNDNYYKLTNPQMDENIVGARNDVNEDTGKKNQADFVLWFTKSKFADQELKWDSPWGVGYPGWHIECSGISTKYLGEYLDIHCGGVDNIFPHHTNEIAQSESYLGHKWCNYWMHVEHLNDKNGKMSKSSGEFLTLSLLEEKKYNPLAYRLFCLQSHYRKQLVFSYEGLDGALNTYEKLKNKVLSIKDDNNFNDEDFNKYNELFKNALKDDLNTSSAVTILFDTIKSDISNNTKLKLIEEFDKVLGLDLLKQETKQIDGKLEEYILEKINLRNEAKKNKDYALADAIRKELEEKNIILTDTREGTKYTIV